MVRKIIYIKSIIENLNKEKNLFFKAIRGNIYDYSLDQNGSRQVQQYFEYGGEEEKNNVWSEIQERAFLLMKDVFGNYVIQKILDKGEKNKY